MKKASSWLRAVFVLLMLCCVGVFAWHVLASGSLNSQLDEAKRDLKNARGNIRAHQTGFSTALDDIMDYQDKLDQMIPESIETRTQVDQYNLEIDELKMQRDRLKAQLKEKLYQTVRGKLPFTVSEKGAAPVQEENHGEE